MSRSLHHASAEVLRTDQFDSANGNYQRPPLAQKSEVRIRGNKSRNHYKNLQSFIVKTQGDESCPLDESEYSEFDKSSFTINGH